MTATPELGRDVHRHVVDAHPGAPDHPQPRRAPQQLRRDPGGAPPDDRVVLADPLHQRGRGSVGHLVHAQRRLGFEERDAVAVDVVGDQDAVGHGGGIGVGTSPDEASAGTASAVWSVAIRQNSRDATWREASAAAAVATHPPVPGDRCRTRGRPTREHRPDSLRSGSSPVRTGARRRGARCDEPLVRHRRGSPSGGLAVRNVPEATRRKRRPCRWRGTRRRPCNPFDSCIRPITRALAPPRSAGPVFLSRIRRGPPPRRRPPPRPAVTLPRRPRGTRAAPRTRVRGATPRESARRRPRLAPPGGRRARRRAPGVRRADRRGVARLRARRPPHPRRPRHPLPRLRRRGDRAARVARPARLGRRSRRRRCSG
jgi:hypothetical protein